jgi:ribosomal protein S18 acetylase RimI-like enzyme
VNVRQAIPGDESILRRLRLAAMFDSPDAFGSSYQRECARTHEDWSRWIANGATFFAEATTAVGLVAAVPDREDRRVVHLMALWVDPGVRGRGAADALIAAVVAWASAHEASTVRLHVEKKNARARRVYERHQFRATGREIAGSRPGFIEVEMERAAVGP